jgi:hypothetical protein
VSSPGTIAAWADTSPCLTFSSRSARSLQSRLSMSMEQPIPGNGGVEMTDRRSKPDA